MSEFLLNIPDVNSSGAKSPRRKTSHISIDTPGIKNSKKCSSLSDGSDSERSTTPSYRPIENTYRLQPAVKERFQTDAVRSVMMQVLECKLKDVKYDAKACGDLSRSLTNEIMLKIKKYQWERYKLVVQLFMGQEENQGIHVASRCVWNAEMDTSACVSYRNTSLFAVASCYAVYFE